MAKKGSGAGLWIVVGALVLIAAIPREIWILLGIVAVIGVVVFIFYKINSPASPDKAPPPSDDGPTLSEWINDNSKSAGNKARPTHSSRTTPPASSPAVQQPSEVRPPPIPDLHTTTIGVGLAKPTSRYSIPRAPIGYGSGRWIPRGEAVEIAGTTLNCGLLYFGTELPAPSGRIDPCLISPQLQVSSRGDFTERQFGYWPSYSEIPPSARRAYINWLAGGCEQPNCDIGYVFLYFYGLERRVIVDSPENAKAKSDWPVVKQELRRLLSIYGASGSFHRYATELLDWMELDESGKLYDRAIPEFERGYELPRYIRLALGQSALDRAPVPAALALRWIRLDPGMALRTPAIRCPEEFDRLFVQRYHEVLGPGLVLPKNRTKLKFVYQPASSGLRGFPNLTRSFGDVPDVTALTGPLKTLQAIVDQCQEELSTYSRALGKDPTARNSLDALVQLPASLWPPEARTRLQSLTVNMKDGMLGTSLQRVLVALGGSKESSGRESVRALARALEALGIGMEPAVLSGARSPAWDDPVVLFSMPAADSNASSTGPYQVAALTLQLASAVAVADGEFGASELAHLRGELRKWTHLTPSHQIRLQAHLKLLLAAPVSLASLSKKLSPLDAKTKGAIAAFMASLAQADGEVSRDELRILEKIYKSLGIEAKQVFSDVHAVGAGSSLPSAEKRTGFKLDAKRIAELQKDSEKVSALLTEIFSEEEPVTVPAPAEIEIEVISSSAFMGMDEAHSALARLMLSRPQWTRIELEDAAADLELMLDGALEQINEAAFDKFEQPLSEGDDPVEINAEILEKNEA